MIKTNIACSVCGFSITSKCGLLFSYSPISLEEHYETIKSVKRQYIDPDHKFIEWIQSQQKKLQKNYFEGLFKISNDH